MCRGWRTYQVRDLAASKRWALNGGPFGSKLTTKHYVGEGVPVIRGINLPSRSRFNAADFVWVSEEKADELLPNNAHPGDLIFTQRGTVGQVGLIPENAPFDRFVISQSQMKLTVDRSKADPLFLYYLFKSPETVQQIRNLAMSSGVPHINLEILRSFAIRLPGISAQKRAAGLLGAYDDMIENALERLRAAEGVARALYRSLFGSTITQDLDFAGWPARRLMDLADSSLASAPKGDLHEPTNYVGLEHIPRRSLALDAWDTVTQLGSNKLRFKRGDILFGKIRPYFHKVCIAPFDGVCSADTIVVRSKSPDYWGIVAGVVSSDEFVAHASATSNGSKMPRANWNVLREYPVRVPPADIARRLTEHFRSIADLHMVLVAQIRNLRETRDLLLPRLMSGQLQLKAD